MNNYKAVIEYDGTYFCGFQVQPKGLRTVQGEIEKALGKVFNERTRICYAGRTDAGVHAVNQVISFKSKEELDLYRFKWSLNSIIPEDVCVKDIEKAAENFDARRSALWREYKYYIVNGNYQSVFLKKYSILVNKELDIRSMEKACLIFKGIKDFTSFSGPSEENKNKVREVFECEIKEENICSNKVIVFKIKANAFLYNMARIIAGTILEIGKGQRDEASIYDAFKAKDRNFAGSIADAKGLFFTGAGYRVI